MVDDVIVPALILGERGLEAARPTLRSPKARAVIAVPLVAVLLKAGIGQERNEHSAMHPRHGWPFASLIEREARRHHLAPALVAAMVAQESNFNPRAYNPSSDASGLMQLTPATAAALGVDDAFNARQSIAAGCRYFRQLLDRFDNNRKLALAAYNAGPTLVARLGRIPRLPETQLYVAAVIKRYARFRSQTSRG